jgi:GH25 family lysozyme M1 (1,4-beta-N-acetylmuramidase)
VTITFERMRRALAGAIALVAFVGTWVGGPAAVADHAAGSSLRVGPPRLPAAPEPAPAQAVGLLPGIDVSHWQETIDWTQVAASGVRFVIAKATEGRAYDDPMYATYKAGASAAGLAFTAYHFARPDDTWHDAIKEADHFVDAAQLGPGNLIPALDLERSGGLTQAQLTQWILDWLGRVTERMGVRPMVYTSPNGWKNRTGDTTAVADAGYTVLWVAHWFVDSPTVPAEDWGGNGWTFWQYTDCGTVPGVTGCVDQDWYAGTTFDAVTIPNPDVTPPVPTLVPPAGLADPVSVAFSEAVRYVTPGNVVLWQPDVAGPVSASMLCRSRTGAEVDCLAGPVRTVWLQPPAPLVADQAYSVLVNPAGVLPAVVDLAGNPAAATQLDFTAPAEVEQDDTGIAYAWRSVANRRAYGRSYLVEHLAGASYEMPFSGRSVTWYTMLGPDQGRAEVLIDGRSEGVFDQYAPRPELKVARTFRGLDRGWHTIVVRVRGTRARAATDTRVAVDAFGFGGRVVTRPDGTAGWRTADVANASGGTVAIADLARESASFTFRGTGVDWYTVRGPSQGRASIFVDGALVKTVDNYADSPTPNVARSVTGLLDGVHTLRILVLGEARPKALGALVTIDRFVVVP